jgi:acetyl esterase/lipase
VYANRDGKDLHVDVYLPQGKGPFPAVLVVHGGAWRTGNKMQLMTYAIRLANHGYAAFAINYRLAPAHKHPAQIEDCRAAVQWIRTNADKYGVDANRIGAIGYSAGGHLVSLLGCEGEKGASEAGKAPSTRIQAVAAGGAPVDFRGLQKDAKPLVDLLGGKYAEKQEVYKEASPAAHVSSDDPPIFFFHGTSDELVGVPGVEAMVKALKAVKVPAELLLVEKGTHISAAMNKAAVERAVQFFDEHLKGAKPAADQAIGQ